MKRILTGALALLLPAQGAWCAIALDATVARDQSPASATVTSPPFSTSATQELLLAFIATDYLGGANTSVQSVAGAGLTWSVVVKTNVQSGSSEIWRAFSPGTLSGVSVSATLSQKVTCSMTVMSFSGVNPSGVNGSGSIGAFASANALKGAPSAALVTTGNNSWVIGVGNDFKKAIARTPGPGQTLVHQYLSAAGDTYWVQMQSSFTPATGTNVTINDTGPASDSYNLSVCEILANPGASSTWGASGTITPAASGAGALLTLGGAMTNSVTADGGGNYSLTGLTDGSYTLTPSKAAFTFQPAVQSFTLNGASQAGINFTAAAIPTWSISGAISPVAGGSGATVNLTGTASGSTMADLSGNYTFTGLTNGTYAVAPSNAGFVFAPPAAAVTVSSSNITGINFTAGPAPISITKDVNVSKDQSTASLTVTSPSFSTAAGGELLLAFVTTDYLSGTNTSVQGISGGGLNWVMVVRTNVQRGTAEIWRTFAPSALGGVSVTATLSQKVISSMTVLSFSGTDQSGVNGSGAIGAVAGTNSAKAAPNASIVATRNNSLVVAAGNDFTNAVARTVGGGQIMVHQYLSPSGDTYWVQMQTNPTALSGTTITMNDTAPTTDSYNLSICEILSGSGNTVTPLPPTVTMTAPAPGTLAGLATVFASTSDNVDILGTQFLLDGSPLGSEIISPPYTITWDSTTTTSGSHTMAAVATNSAGQTATSPAINVVVDNSDNPAIVGSWSTPITLPAVAVNLILLPSDRVLFYQDGTTATVWNYVTNTFLSVPIAVDLFCSGAALLGDGRVFVAGGYGDSGAIGIANAEIFDPTTNIWTAVPRMTYKRWYPSATTLADGTIMVTAGWQTTAHSNAGISEIYNPVSNSWTDLANANNPFETYPFLYQQGDGTILHIGGSEYPTDTDVLNISTQTWSVIDSRIIDGGSSSMYAPGLFMKAGSASDSQGVGAASNTTFVLDMTQPTPAWLAKPPMAYPRSFLNLTTLPDGTVLATGGETDKNGGNINNAVYAAELWSPQTATWTTLASMHTPREYHGTALLLPDGRVLESGMGADFGNVPNELSAEFYSPPYLFKGTRPIITQSPSQVQYGASFFVTTPDSATIKEAVLIRTGAVTHFFDQNARYVPVSIQQGPGGLTITAPANGNLAPPGYYMLFLINSSGIPSVAPFVLLN